MTFLAEFASLAAITTTKTHRNSLEANMRAFLCGFMGLIFALTLYVPRSFAQQAPVYSDVRQIFQTRCIKCHSGKQAPEGLHLDSYKGVMAGSEDMPVIIKGQPARSELVKRIKGISMPRMPKDGPPWLSEDEIRLIENWIAKGAAE